MLSKMYTWTLNHIMKGRETLAQHGFWGIDFSEETKQKIYHKDKSKEVKE